MEDWEKRINEAISLSELDELETALENDNDDLSPKELEYLLDLIDTKKGDFE